MDFTARVNVTGTTANVSAGWRNSHGNSEATSGAQQNDVYAIGAVRTERHRLLDVRSPRRSGNEADSARQSCAFHAQQRPGIFHRAHDPITSQYGNVRFR